MAPVQIGLGVEETRWADIACPVHRASARVEDIPARFASRLGDAGLLVDGVFVVRVVAGFEGQACFHVGEAGEKPVRTLLAGAVRGQRGRDADIGAWLAHGQLLTAAVAQQRGCDGLVAGVCWKENQRGES